MAVVALESELEYIQLIDTLRRLASGRDITSASAFEARKLRRTEVTLALVLQVDFFLICVCFSTMAALRRNLAHSDLVPCGGLVPHALGKGNAVGEVSAQGCHRRCAWLFHVLHLPTLAHLDPWFQRPPLFFSLDMFVVVPVSMIASVAVLSQNAA